MNADDAENDRPSDEPSPSEPSFVHGRDRLIANIGEAFGEVSLMGGRSWTQCEILDTAAPKSHGPPSHKQNDRPWQLLTDDSTWQPFPGIGGFAFIDEIGFRYYLPPTMIRFVRGDVSHWYETHLPTIITGFLHIADETGEQPGDLSWTECQLRCIARFIAFMANDRSPNGDDSSRTAWRAMLDAGWHRHLANHTER